ncbi:hypothetical protein CEE45_09130 [Candidatus Heimdallarchaeota archaeon B3_Heim]|nr:MAG: hypothetical protein CEE45_09130 [Candidatus Heimdallarchaeota archaeon B3_Heim]
MGSLTITHKELIVAGLVTVIYLFTGFTPNPFAWPGQISNRIALTETIQPDNPQIEEFNAKFEDYYANEFVPLSSFPSDPIELEIYAVGRFTIQEIEYGEDITNYLSWDYRPSLSEVLNRGSDDCDGRAIVACSLLTFRGYDSYVVIGKWHAWVEVHLEEGRTITILDEGLQDISPWYTKYNTEKIDFQWLTFLDLVLHNFLLILLFEKIIIIIYSFLNQNRDFYSIYAVLIALGLSPIPILILFSLMRP